MSKISSTTHITLGALRSKVANDVRGCATLEESAQKFTEIMYKEFEDSIVLVRLFATIPFGKLETLNQAFVTRLAASQGIKQLITDKMLVLSLLGTCGEEADWCDRRNSQGHVGIPLASEDFIERIPMMSRLLKELGLDLDWIDEQDTNIVARILGKMAGVFYVSDAKTAVDHKDRLIIAAQDFVDAYNVVTVFGLGGGYLTNATFITSIVFTREALTKQQVEQFLPLVNEFKTATMPLISSGKVFAR
ncbi:MAG: hypothetical protein GY832_42525 [Chloroflexi bacterium]|nr:hypothetical protein [Chloroflexota bacterium]